MITKNHLKLIMPYRVLLIILMAVLLSGSLSAQNFSPDYEDGRIYFKFKDNIPLNYNVNSDNSAELDAIPFISDLQAEYNLKALSRPFYLNNDDKLLRTFMLEFADPEKMDEIINRLSKNPDLEYVERVPVYRISYVPNDTLYNLISGASNLKWHLDRIKADSAWNITKGSSTIKVAVVDNAVWADHPDLAGKIAAQWDVTKNMPNSNPPVNGNPSVSWSHGTHVAGLAAASSDNFTGVASIGFNVSIIAVKAAFDTASTRNIARAYEGLQWAAENGADVINLSWGGSGSSETHRNLINSIHSMGIVIVAAAGNENVSAPHYPSGYDNVISVASTDGNDIKSGFSNYGTTVDLCAPGGSNPGGPSGLLSTSSVSTLYGKYELMSGTSMASPVAAGLAGLILSLNPQLTPDEVGNIMKTTADSIYAVNPTYVGKLGSGRINAYRAVSQTSYPPIAKFSTPVTTILPNSSINFKDISTGIPSDWYWNFEGAGTNTSGSKNPTGISYPEAGTFDVTLNVTNKFGSNTLILRDYITVTTTPAPYIFMTVSDTTLCIGNSVSLKDSSLYSPTAWEWIFNPSTVSFLNGTTSLSQNPEVKFLAPGDYSLQHKAINANGSSAITFGNKIHVAGAIPDYSINMENGKSGYFVLTDTIKSKVSVDAKAAHESLYGIHMHGSATPTGWVGGPTSATPDQAWNKNKAFQSEAHICGVDAAGIPYLVLSLDLRQTSRYGPNYSWFRVLVNGVQVPDNHGVLDFNPVTLSDDPWKRVYFDLSPYTGSIFDITLQSSCRFSDNDQGIGDDVFIDNISIKNVTVTGNNKIEAPVISLFPNPSKGRITFSASPISGQAVLKVNSMVGKTVFAKTISSKESKILQDLDLSFLTPGVYIVSITEQVTNKQSIQRLVIRP